MPKDIDFPTSQVWSDHYAQKGGKPPPQGKTPGEKEMLKILESLYRLTGFKPPQPESTPQTSPTPPATQTKP